MQPPFSEAPHQPLLRYNEFIWDIIYNIGILYFACFHTDPFLRFSSDLQSGMGGDLSPAGSGSEEPPLSVQGVDATGGYLQKQTPTPTKKKQLGLSVLVKKK